jgi:hypothetical protein
MRVARANKPEGPGAGESIQSKAALPKPGIASNVEVPHAFEFTIAASAWYMYNCGNVLAGVAVQSTPTMASYQLRNLGGKPLQPTSRMSAYGLVDLPSAFGRTVEVSKTAPGKDRLRAG